MASKAYSPSTPKPQSDGTVKPRTCTWSDDVVVDDNDADADADTDDDDDDDDDVDGDDRGTDDADDCHPMVNRPPCCHRGYSL